MCQPKVFRRVRAGDKKLLLQRFTTYELLAIIEQMCDFNIGRKERRPVLRCRCKNVRDV